MKRFIDKFLNRLMDKSYTFIKSAEETNKPIAIIKAMYFIFIAAPILQISYWCWCVCEWCKEHKTKIQNITKCIALIVACGLTIIGVDCSNPLCLIMWWFGCVSILYLTRDTWSKWIGLD